MRSISTLAPFWGRGWLVAGAFIRRREPGEGGYAAVFKTGQGFECPETRPKLRLFTQARARSACAVLYAGRIQRFKFT